MENTTDKTITHTYIANGVYNVTVVASNSITTKENTTIITGKKSAKYDGGGLRLYFGRGAQLDRTILDP